MFGIKTLVFAVFLLAAMLSAELLTEDEKTDMLSRHNQKRCMAGVDALAWDDDLAAAASSWAAGGHGTTHSKALGAFSDYGECIQGACPDDTPAQAMQFWYDEISKYSEASPFQASHYTQVVWKGTKKVGCGKTEGNFGFGCSGKMYVCQYLPMGNVYGQYGDNVFAPTKDVSQCPLGCSPSGGAAATGDNFNDDKGAVKTKKGCPCKSACGGASYNWCWVHDDCEHVAGTTDGKGWGYCTPSVHSVMTDGGCQCNDQCGTGDESYTWCHTTSRCDYDWDYCTPARLYDENTSLIMARSTPNMVFPALAVFALALLTVGAIVVRRRAKPAEPARAVVSRDAVLMADESIE